LKNEKITEADELFAVAWSNELTQSNGEVTAIFAAHFSSRIFLWEVFKNEKESTINIM